MQRRWSAAALASALIAGLLAPLAYHWVNGRTLVWFDSANLFTPLRTLVGEALRAGRLPLWNPYAATGTPLFADPVHGVLHPCSVVAAFLAPGDGLDPLIGLHVLAAGTGAAVLARGLGATPLASIAAGLAYGLSGFTLSMTGNLPFLAGAGALPWTVAGLRLAGATASAGAFAAGASSVAIGALAGDVQSLAVGAGLGLLLAAVSGRLPGLLRAAGATGAGALLAGIQLAPSWAFLGQTTRAAGLTPEDLVQWRFSPWRAVELAVPGLFVHPQDGYAAPVFRALVPDSPTGIPFAASVFVGAPVLLLAALGARATRVSLCLAGACAVLLWLALGPLLGAQQLSLALPIVRGFRYSEKYVGALVLCAAVLAGLGLDRATSERRQARRLALAAIAGAGAAAAAWLAASGPLLPPAGAPAAEAMRAHLRAGLPHALASLLALGGAALLALRGRSAAAAASIVGLCWAEAVTASPLALRPGAPEARRAVPAPALPAGASRARLIQLGRVPDRGAPEPWDFHDRLAFAYAAVGGPNYNAAQGIDQLTEYSGFRSRRYAATSSAFARRWALAARRFALTHVQTPPPSDPDTERRVERVAGGGTLVLVEPRTGTRFFSVPHREWAAFPPRVEVVPDAESALARLVRLVDAGDGAAVVEGDAPLPVAPGRVLRVQRERETIRVEAEADADAVLVLNDAYWPGWRAAIDGQRIPILAADSLVRAVRWPAGRHVLEMRYEPREVRVGAALSACGLLIVGGVFALFRSRREPARTGPTA